MKPVAKNPTPAALAVLRQATALWPKRNKASDGLLPSAAHISQNPNSDHNTGYAVDLTHDPRNGVNCTKIYEEMKKDIRVKYLIFKGKIWVVGKGETQYKGANPHDKHLHISIKDGHGKDTANWFPWANKPRLRNKIKAGIVKSKPKKKDVPSPKED